MTAFKFIIYLHNTRHIMLLYMAIVTILTLFWEKREHSPGSSTHGNCQQQAIGLLIPWILQASMLHALFRSLVALAIKPGVFRSQGQCTSLHPFLSSHQFCEKGKIKTCILKFCIFLLCRHWVLVLNRNIHDKGLN